MANRAARRTAGKRGEHANGIGSSVRTWLARRSGRFVEIPGNEMAFTIDKVRLEQATFSAEALEGMCDQVRAYIASRVWRAYHDSDWKVPPRHLKVLVVVDVGDSSFPDGDEVEGTPIDPAEWGSG